jgi:hypothetical protein
MVASNRTACEWFTEAARCYLEHHQGCAWCGGSHLVFHNQCDHKCEYHCSGCDFRAGYNADTDRYFTFPGDRKSGEKPPTMHEI